jgi:hypothetical protein
LLLIDVGNEVGRGVSDGLGVSEGVAVGVFVGAIVGIGVSVSGGATVVASVVVADATGEGMDIMFSSGDGVATTFVATTLVATVSVEDNAEAAESAVAVDAVVAGIATTTLVGVTLLPSRVCWAARFASKSLTAVETAENTSSRVQLVRIRAAISNRAICRWRVCRRAFLADI